MGGDGGVIAVQRRFMPQAISKEARVKGKNLKEELRQRARLCAVSSKTLFAPIVACPLGNLFNKEAILQVLVDKSLPENLSHIRGLRDLTELLFTPNPRGERNEPYSTEGDNDASASAAYICPVLRSPEFNGMTQFVYLKTTGVVMSEKAVREMGIDSLQDEYGPFTVEDVVKIIPSSEETAVLRAALKRVRAAKKEKKNLKEKERSKRKHEYGGSSERACDNFDVDVDVSTQSKSLSLQHKQAKTARLGASTAAAVREAAVASESEVSKSAIFDKHFHKDQGPAVDGAEIRKLMMSTAGLRGTLG
jgi:hypothetical protein